MTTTGSDLVSHIRSILDKKDKDADHINLSEFLQRLSKQPRNTLCFVFEAVALSRNKDALDALLRVLNGKLPTAPIQQKIHLAASDLHQVGMGIKQAEKELEKESVEKGKKAKKRGLNNGKRAATLSLPSDYPVGYGLHSLFMYTCKNQHPENADHLLAVSARDLIAVTARKATVVVPLTVPITVVPVILPLALCSRPAAMFGIMT